MLRFFKFCCLKSQLSTLAIKQQLHSLTDCTHFVESQEVDTKFNIWRKSLRSIGTSNKAVTAMMAMKTLKHHSIFMFFTTLFCFPAADSMRKNLTVAKVLLPSANASCFQQLVHFFGHRKHDWFPMSAIFTIVWVTLKTTGLFKMSN